MSANTSIEWTDKTWNPVRGCSMVSEGCRNCYAMKVATRFSGPGQPYEGLAKDGKWTGKVKLIEAALEEPLRWRKPCRIFVNSMSDLFHEQLSFLEIARVFAVMASATLGCHKHHDHEDECWTGNKHTFQILTKRPERMREFIKEAPTIFAENFHPEEAICVSLEVGHWPLRNVWLGVSVEDQKAADERIPLLLEAGAAVRFLSCEPLLGPIDLRAFTYYGSKVGNNRGIDWVIVGGESGPQARPCGLEWVRHLADQCKMAGIPYFVKQLGRWILGEETGFGLPQKWMFPGGAVWVPGIIGPDNYKRPDNAVAFQLTDNKGGNWNDWPKDLRVRQFPP